MLNLTLLVYALKLIIKKELNLKTYINKKYFNKCSFNNLFSTYVYYFAINILIFITHKISCITIGRLMDKKIFVKDNEIKLF